MKKLTAILLVLVLLLAGCGVQQQTTEGTTAGTVPDLFTQPATVPQATVAPQTTAPKVTYPKVPDRDMPRSLGLGFAEQELVYTGGEMRVQVMVDANGFSNIGLGLRLFVDGQPQPYHTAEDETVSYMHTFYPADREVHYYEVIFTPVAGKAGESVELYVTNVNDPTYFLGDGDFGFRHTFNCVRGVATVRMDAEPPAQTLPEVSDILLNWNCSYVDVGSSESVNGSSVQTTVSWKFYINDQKDSYNFYSVTKEDTIRIRFEITGCPYVNYGFVIYADNQPVSVSEEDMMFFDVQNGKKTVIEAEISLENFDGKSVVNAVLAPRNHILCGVDNMADLSATKTSYFAAVEEYWDLFE